MSLEKRFNTRPMMINNEWSYCTIIVPMGLVSKKWTGALSTWLNILLWSTCDALNKSTHNKIDFKQYSTTNPAVRLV